MILIQKPDTNEMENPDVDPRGGRLVVPHHRLTQPPDITKEHTNPQSTKSGRKTEVAAKTFTCI
jgi:hypothetical protein